MAKLKIKNEQQVSLFPMFNILVCTLGVLIFILSTVTTISLGVGKTIKIVPELAGENEHSKTPTYIEWNGKDLIAYPSKLQVHFDKELREISTYKETYKYMEEMIEKTPFGDLINNIYQNTQNEYIVFLVRPSGFLNFIDVRGYFEKHKVIDFGYEPIDQDFKL